VAAAGCGASSGFDLERRPLPTVDVGETVCRGQLPHRQHSARLGQDVSEATTSTVHRAAPKSGAARHTDLTNVFTGRPARGIVSRIIREVGPISPAAPAFPSTASALASLRARAEGLGRGDFSPPWAGQNAGGCKGIPAARLTRELAAGL
jgi:hypothetical protein